MKRAVGHRRRPRCEFILYTLWKSSKQYMELAPEPEGLSPHSQQPATGTYPQPIESTPYPPPPIQSVQDHF
jgi:hypothetical protein